MTYILLLIFQFLFASNNLDPLPINNISSQSDIVIRVNNIQDLEGEILVGIYDSKRTFRKIKKVYKYAVKTVESGNEVIMIKDVPEGTYAIALFQDLNGNRKFDSNFMGVPKEPFGFSTNFVVKRRAPKYKEVTFNHTDDRNTEMDINIQIW